MDPRTEFFLLVVRDYLHEYSTSVFNEDELTEHGEGFVAGGGLRIIKGKRWLRTALDELVGLGALEVVRDDFAGDHFLTGDRTLAEVENLLERDSSRYKAFVRMGDAGHDWLARALVGIERTDEEFRVREKIDYERWEPIRFDPNDASTAEAIEQVETAIRQIAADNGFAATYPLERDAILSAANATLKSVKDGLAPRNSIKQNFISAGRWISEKFGASAIGAFGSELVKWGLRLLGLPV